MLYIITPVFKRLPKTIAFYQSLVQHIGINNFTLIIGDDCTDYEHVQYFKNNKNIIVLRGTGDLFWGGTINICLDYLLKQKGEIKNNDLIVFANNDIIIDASTFPLMKQCISKQPDAIFHPRVFNLENKEIQSGAILKNWAPILCTYPIDFKKELVKVDMITGRFLMLRFSALQIIGKIAPNLPHYAGDNDFSMRAKKLGFPTYLVRDAKCFVDESTSGNKLKSTMSLKEFSKALKDIRSPLNLKYKFRLIRNHNNLLFSYFAITMEALKSFYKFLEAKRN